MAPDPREEEDCPREAVEARPVMPAPEGVPGRLPTAVTAGADTEKTYQFTSYLMNHLWNLFFTIDFFFIYLVFFLLYITMLCFFSCLVKMKFNFNVGYIKRSNTTCHDKMYLLPFHSAEGPIFLNCVFKNG